MKAVCAHVQAAFFLQKFTLQNLGAAYTRNLKNNPDAPRKSRYHVDD
jgi:hypothetical protein